MSEPLTAVPGHEAMPEGKTERDWAFRAHCKADGEAWPCRSVLLATLDAAHGRPGLDETPQQPEASGDAAEPPWQECGHVHCRTRLAARDRRGLDVDWLSATLASLEGKEELHILDAYSYDEAAGIITAEYDALRFAAAQQREGAG